MLDRFPGVSQIEMEFPDEASRTELLMHFSKLRNDESLRRCLQEKVEWVEKAEGGGESAVQGDFVNYLARLKLRPRTMEDLIQDAARQAELQNSKAVDIGYAVERMK